MNNLVDHINNILEHVAAAHHFTFVSVDAGFNGHRFCDSGPAWFQSNILPFVDENMIAADGRLTEDAIERNPELDFYNHGLFHPTAQGQMVYTRALEHTLGCI